MATAVSTVNNSNLRRQHYTPRSAQHLVKVIVERDSGLSGIVLDHRKASGHRLPDGTPFALGAARTAIAGGMYVVWKRLRTRDVPFGIGQTFDRWKQQTRSIADRIDEAPVDAFLDEVFARYSQRRAGR